MTCIHSSVDNENQPVVWKGPMIGNAINSARNIPLVDGGADTMTTLFIPAPEIFLVAGIVSLLIFALIPLLLRLEKKIQK